VFTRIRVLISGKSKQLQLLTSCSIVQQLIIKIPTNWKALIL